MEADASMTDGHLCNMGRMIEEMESKMRNGLDQVNFCILRMDLKEQLYSGLSALFN